MSFSTVIVFLLLTSCLAAFADRFLLSSRLEPFRKGLEKLWVQFDSPKAHNLTLTYNTIFCDLFDLIYGEKMFSKRRVVTSIISTISAYTILFSLGFFITVYAYGGDLESADMTYLGAEHITLSMMFVVAFNLIPDFISLAETRLVLRWSKNRGIFGMLFFIALDIASTLFVFTLALLISMLFFFSGMTGLYSLGPSAEALLGLVDGLDGGDFGLVFIVSLATTFFTSFFWICFASLYIITRIAYRLFPFTKHLYQQIAESDKPVMAIVGFLNIMVVILWTIAWSAGWLI